jgi:hypothetical protein
MRYGSPRDKNRSRDFYAEKNSAAPAGHPQGGGCVPVFHLQRTLDGNAVNTCAQVSPFRAAEPL